MIRSAVTLSLVSESRGGPFVFWDDLRAACSAAATLGFDAIELFPPGPDEIDVEELRKVLHEYRLGIAAVGSGAGFVKHRLVLTDALPDHRKKAREFIRGMIDLAAGFGAPAIVGSMQGRWHGEVTRELGLRHLVEALGELGEYAKTQGNPLLFEPLNRYETNFINNVEGGLELLGRVESKNVKLLCDLFHMNIEEVDIAAALRQAGKNVGHVHFADSNRRPAGLGHIDYAPIAAALKENGFDGFVSAEALPFPNSAEAAKQTMAAYKKYFRVESI
jgi:sugar phosphate isomerase/epimerase